ncbi:IclR family transcriptional regulator [Pontimonas sp.]|nr:IclR family transcriptional regulator [Pontimonas sp.]MDB4607010.1 IclR family transcriptional regulator [Pontimonas sp.]
MAPHSSGLVRDLEVLELLGTDASWQDGGMGVQEIATRLGRDKGQVSRVCHTLASTGLVNRDRITRKYRLGHHLYALAMRTQEAHLATLARPALLELMASAEESAHLTVLRGGDIMTVHTELAQDPERDDRFDGISLPALKTASGRAILATFTPDEIAAWWEEHGELRMDYPTHPETSPIQLTEVRRLRKKPNSLNSLAALQKALKTAQKAGFAIADGDLTENIVDAAAPVRNAFGIVVGAISVGARKNRIRDGNIALGQLVFDSARALSLRLGWTGT